MKQYKALTGTSQPLQQVFHWVFKIADQNKTLIKMMMIILDQTDIVEDGDIMIIKLGDQTG